MPFSSLSEFEHAGEAKKRQRNPRNVEKWKCAEERWEHKCRRRKANWKSNHNAEVKKEEGIKGQTMSKTDKEIEQNRFEKIMKQFNKQTARRNEANDNVVGLQGEYVWNEHFYL